jgi:transposase
MIKPSFIPPPAIRHLRELIRYRVKLTNMLTCEKNRAHNCLTVSSLKLDDVFSDIFGKSARSIIEYILAHPGEHFDVTPFIDKHCKTPVDVIQDAVDGAISPEQAVKLRECLNHIDELSAHRDNIEKEILELVKPFSAQLALIRTVPGLDKDPMTAITILSEICSDMSVFPTAKNLVSWAGCCPRNDKSAKHVKSTRIAAAGSFLKPILVQVANALIKSTKHPEFTERYRRIKSHRGHKKAMIALCKMFLTAIWNILSTGEVYNPSGYILQSPRPVNVKKVLTQKQALELLSLRGFTIVDDSSPQAAPA